MFDKKGSVYIRGMGIVLGIMLLAAPLSNAQDIQFSQFYANVLYLNPAFAGSAHATRGILHQRLQWPSLEARYITSSFSADYFFRQTGSGVGLMFFKDWQGSDHISSTDFSLLYAQEVNISPTHSLRAGVQGGYVGRYANYAKLTFPDQFNDNGYARHSTSEPFGSNKINYFDVSLGGIFYSNTYWVGFSSHHINTPNQSFYGKHSNLPVKLTLIGGYKVIFEEVDNRTGRSVGRDVFITPTFHYKFQGKSDQVDVGVYSQYDRLLLGYWYRGIPLLKRYKKGYQNNESMVLLAGFKVSGLSFAYSYDFTVSKLASAITGGSHEINITYICNWPAKRKKNFKKLPCPHFYK